MLLSVETVIVHPNQIARTGLASLIEKYCFRVIAAAASATDVLESLPAERPRLVILGNGDTAALVRQADACRQEWPACKIVLLHDCSGGLDQALLVNASPNACVPMSVSDQTLLKLLDVIVHEQADVFILTRSRSEQDTPELPNRERETDPTDNKRTNGGSGHSDAASSHSEQIATACDAAAQLQNGKKLSDRELQVLDGIVRGLQNKMIARECHITEATVKVHMKSILRKIHVSNRTQAALWAVEHKIACGPLETRAGTPKASQSAALTGLAA
jgi:two-component system nitrate/nitrite response regulator NarL